MQYVGLAIKRNNKPLGGEEKRQNQRTALTREGPLGEVK